MENLQIIFSDICFTWECQFLYIYKVKKIIISSSICSLGNGQMFERVVPMRTIIDMMPHTTSIYFAPKPHTFSIDVASVTFLNYINV